MGLAASQCRLLLLTARLSDTEYRAQMISARRMALAMQTEQIATDYSNALNNRSLYHVFDLNGNENKVLTEELNYNNLMDVTRFGGGQFRVVLPDGRIAVPSIEDIPDLIIGDDNEDGSQTYAFVTDDMVRKYVEAHATDSNKYEELSEFLDKQEWTTDDYKNARTVLEGDQVFNSFALQYAKEHNLIRQSQPVNNKGFGTYYLLDEEGQEYVILPALNNPKYFQNAIRTGGIEIQKYDPYNTENDGWSNYDIISSPYTEDKLYTEDDNAARAEYESKSAIIQAQDKFLEIELKQVETQHQAAQTEYDSVKKVIDKNIERSFKTFG